MSIQNKWTGPTASLSAQNSRLLVEWSGANPNYDPLQPISITNPQFLVPGNTSQNQWFIDPGTIKLYDNTSKPGKNQQTITFNCEFDSTTNLGPGLGQTYDQAQAAGTEPVPLSDTLSAKTFLANIPGAGQTLNTITSHNYGANEPLTSNVQPYLSHYKLYSLHVLTPGRNQGSYLIQNHTIGITDVITIYGTNVPAGLSGSFIQAQNGVQCSIELFDHFLPSDPNWVSSGPSTHPNHPDIQTDLQTNPGAFTLTATLHTWVSPKNSSILHKFDIIPYWLLQSRLLQNTIVPTWSFTCKCYIREVDITGSTFVNLWNN